MQFHDFLVKTSRRKKRIGRGGKRGTTSGRGTKGQKSRAGHKIRPQIRDTIKQIPKRRGVRFSPTSSPVVPIDLALVEKNFRAGEKVTPSVLETRGLVRLTKGERVKVLDRGALTKKIIFENINASKRAAEKIIALGGELRNIEK